MVQKYTGPAGEATLRWASWVANRHLNVYFHWLFSRILRACSHVLSILTSRCPDAAVPEPEAVTMSVLQLSVALTKASQYLGQGLRIAGFTGLGYV
jgi:hypothetical protein